MLHCYMLQQCDEWQCVYIFCNDSQGCEKRERNFLKPMDKNFDALHDKFVLGMILQKK